MTHFHAGRRAVVAALLASCAATGAFAQAKYPDHPVTFVVPFAAGSATDQLARALGASISGASTALAFLVSSSSSIALTAPSVDGDSDSARKPSRAAVSVYSARCCSVYGLPPKSISGRWAPKSIGTVFPNRRLRRSGRTTTRGCMMLGCVSS